MAPKVLADPWHISTKKRLFCLRIWQVRKKISNEFCGEFGLLTENVKATHFFLVFNAIATGFTAWSDKRSPTEVFQLLEAIYSAFDLLAEKYSVYKIETIGDCCKFF